MAQALGLSLPSLFYPPSLPDKAGGEQGCSGDKGDAGATLGTVEDASAHAMDSLVAKGAT